MKTQKPLFSFFTALVIISATSAFAQTPPPNDDFANRTVLTDSSITFTGTLVGATTEPTETYTNVYLYEWPFSRSVWWTWTAAEWSTVVIAIQPDGWANNTNAWLEVYGGTNLALTLLWEGETHAGTAFTKPPSGYVRFQATAGTSYQIRVAGGTNVGGPFTLQLTATNAPIFIAQPQNCTVSPYGSAFFGAIATEPPLITSLASFTTYQWYFNGVPIPGEIYPSLLVHGVTTNQAGSYSVTASNVGGITQGGSATLTVVDTNPVPRSWRCSQRIPASYHSRSLANPDAGIKLNLQRICRIGSIPPGFNSPIPPPWFRFHAFNQITSFGQRWTSILTSVLPG